MSKPTTTATTTNTAFEVAPEFASALPALVPSPAPIVSPTTAGQALALLRDVLRRTKQALRAKVRTKVEQVLAEHRVVRNGLVVHDYFGNTVAGVPITLHNAGKPREALGRVIDELGEDSKFQEIALLEDVDPELDPNDPHAPPVHPVDDVCETIASRAERGVLAHVTATVRPRAYADAVREFMKHPLLGSQPHRESVQVFIDRLVHKDRDRDEVTAHSPLGAVLGRRVHLDAYHHVAEPLDGDRGGIGVLRGVHIVRVPGRSREFLEEQRATLATFGINTLRRWTGVGNAVVVTNRSLREGGSVYLWASTTRLRSFVQAVFHSTTEHEIRGAGKRAAGPLDAVAGKMNTFLGDLQAAGWIRCGKVSVDYADLKVRIKVEFEPCQCIDDIAIEFYEDSHGIKGTQGPGNPGRS
ncbi:MAG: hypothetical protein IPM29_04520 [Planctomycetes bacterium]|nr:hypothetical protein [Planctomycetota bacterium]